MIIFKKINNKFRKIVWLSPLLIIPSTIAVSCSHIDFTQAQSNYSTSIKQEEQIIIKIPESKFSEYTSTNLIWQNLDYFKEQIFNSNLIQNFPENFQMNDIAIPYSSISQIDNPPKKAISLTFYLRSYFYNGEIIQFSNSNITYKNGNSISLDQQTFNDLYKLDNINDQNYHIIAPKYIDIILQNINFNVVPTSPNTNDIYITNITKSSSEINLDFNLRSVYSTSGLKEIPFSIKFTSSNNNLKQITLNDNYVINKNNFKARVIFIPSYN